MATFTVDPDELTCSIWLDSEPEELDLTQHNLGAMILQELGIALHTSAVNGTGPDGVAWPPLAPLTIRRTGPHRTGFLTGAMLSLTRFVPGVTTIHRRRATWGYVHEGRNSTSWGKAKGFHDGDPANNRPPRPLFGWPQAIQDFARDLLTTS